MIPTLVAGNRRGIWECPKCHQEFSTPGTCARCEIIAGSNRIISHAHLSIGDIIQVGEMVPGSTIRDPSCTYLIVDYDSVNPEFRIAVNMNTFALVEVRCLYAGRIVGIRETKNGDVYDTHIVPPLFATHLHWRLFKRGEVHGKALSAV